MQRYSPLNSSTALKERAPICLVARSPLRSRRSTDSLTRRQSVRSRLLTPKILRIIRAAGAVVVRRRRICAQRTRAFDDAGGDVCGFDRLRLLSCFHPLIDRSDFVEDVSAGTALAVPHD